MSLKQRAYDAWFRHVHGSRLVYNTCWEDPRADRALLDLKPGARIAMITSAGCNALDYLLDDPAEIHCVDLNPRQNALLDLKLAALSTLPHADLWALFGEGRHGDFENLYRYLLRVRLAPESAAFWDRHLHWFEGRGRGSFYFRGAAGDIAWWLRAWLKALRPRLRRELLALFESPDLPTQGFDAFLAAHPGEFTHFVLLDHQDWLWAHDRAGLEREWRLILARSAPGARVLLRSAALQVEFLPAFARAALRERADEQRWHQRDRVGTYGSTLLAEVAA